MLIHLVYVWIGLLIGFLVGCWWVGRRLAEAIYLNDMAQNLIECLSKENMVLAQRKPPRRIYRSRSNLLTDDESDALWESVMGGPDA
jgi:hypothetical protein